MTTWHVSVSDEMNAFVESEMATQGHASLEEYLRALVVELQHRRAKQALEAKFREAVESGPAGPFTPESWAELRQESLDGLVGERIEP